MSKKTKKKRKSKKTKEQMNEDILGLPLRLLLEEEKRPVHPDRTKPRTASFYWEEGVCPICGKVECEGHTRPKKSKFQIW